MTARPVRLQLSRRKGFDLQALSLATNGLPAVNVARPGRWGNPFDFRRSEYCWIALSFGCRGDRLGRQEASVMAFRAWIAPEDGRRTDSLKMQPKMVSSEGEVALGSPIVAGAAPPLAELVAALRGRNLACWCAMISHGRYVPCHGDVLLELANIDAKEP